MRLIRSADLQCRPQMLPHRAAFVVLTFRSAPLCTSFSGTELASSRVMTNRPRRLKTFSYLGCYRYSLTFCTNFRAHVFVDAPVVQLVLSQFLRAADEEGFSLLAYCFMPDHVHLLVQGDSEWSDGRRLIRRGKQYAGYAYSAAYRRKLWQPWGFERVLRDEESSAIVARYIWKTP